MSSTLESLVPQPANDSDVKPCWSHLNMGTPCFIKKGHSGAGTEPSGITHPAGAPH